MDPNRRDFIRMGAIAGATALAKGVSAQTGGTRSSASAATLPLPEGPEFAGMSGAYAALITPYKPDGSVNEEMIERIIEFGLANGLTGFYLTGSTGEGFLLSPEERKKIILDLENKGLSTKDIAKTLALEWGESKKALYAEVLEMLK